jgi:hypothetical protein
MRLTDTGGKEFEQAPIGNHVGRCIGMIDLGTQQGEYLGKTTHARKIVLRFELPNELISEGEFAGKPFVVSKFYTASLGEKANLRKDLQNWRNREFTEQELQGFDAKNILDKCCLLALTTNDKGKVRVTGVMALPKGTQPPARVNQIVYFSLDEFDQAVFDSLSDGYKKLITVSPEYQAIKNPGAQEAKRGGAAFDDMMSDIPF